MTLARRALDRLTDGANWAGFAFIVLMALHIAFDVLGKFVFSYPLDGTGEIVTHYYMVGVIFAPLAHVQRKGAHIFAELATRGLRGRARHALDAVVNLLMTVFAGLLIWRTGAEALRATRIGEHVQTVSFLVPTWPTRWFLPIGLAVMALYAALQCAASLAAARAPRR